MRDPFACTDDGAMTPPPEPPLEAPTDSPRHSRHRQSGWQHWLPGLTAFRHYPIGWLRYDLVAGLVLTSLLIPSGIAYAAASVLLPPLFLLRVLNNVIRKKRYFKQALLALPAIVVLGSVWALGEFVAYLTARAKITKAKD